MVDPHLDSAVHVATVRMDRPEVSDRLDRYRALLSADERERERRLLRAADRERFVVARALTRLLLARFGGRPPAHWQFVTNGYGRPQLVPEQARKTPLHFNLSHTHGLVAVTIARDRDVGVDVEFLDRHLTHDVAERFFAPAEVADLHALPPVDRERVFFDYWTLKEAYIKARGMGLALPLRHFAFKLNPDAAPAISFDQAIDDEPTSWQFVQSRPTPHHRLALAVRRVGADLPVHFDDCVPEPDA